MRRICIKNELDWFGGMRLSSFQEWGRTLHSALVVADPSNRYCSVVDMVRGFNNCFGGGVHKDVFMDVRVPPKFYSRSMRVILSNAGLES